MKKTKKYFMIGFAIILMVIFLPDTKVMAAAPQTSKTVRVACGMNDALYLDEAGNPAGICLPYLRRLSWVNNWTYEYVEGSYSEGIQNLYDGKVDLMFPVGKDDDVEERLAFADFIGGYQQIGLFTRADADIYYEDYEGFDGKKVGLSMGANSNIMDEYAQKHGFSYQPVGLNTIQDKIDALDRGEVDLLAFSTLNTVPNGKLVAVLDQVPFYFCTRDDNQELLQEINYGMSVSMIDTPDIVSQMYEDVLKGNNKISYTKEENDKIGSTDKITFGVYSDCLPLAGINSEGECVGIYVDILKELEKESGLHIEIKPITDSNRLYSYLDDGTVDYVIGLQELRFSQENADNHLASNGITEYTTVAVTMPNYQFEQDGKPVIALTKARNFLEDYIYNEFPGARISYYDTRKECLNAVQKGEADATFINTWEYNYETKNPRFQELMERESLRMTSVVGLGATRQADMEILSILEKTISQIPEDTLSDIIALNLDMPYQSYNLEDRFYRVRTELFVMVLVGVIIVGGLAIYLNIKRKYIRDLVIANKAKSDFLSRMSHELRTPLNAIHGYAAITTQNAAKGDTDEQVLLENMDSIEKASDYLLGIIKDILDLQQMETGKITLEKADINLAEYMKTIVKMIQPMADEKSIQFTYTMINGGTDHYLLDGLRLQQVLLNILYNAVKFTSAGGNVTMTTELADKDEKDATIRFMIADTGIGMSKDFMENKLFHKFAQENQDITSPYTGCGNGLVICKELVEMMDGQISCVSEQGKGTTFTILIRAQHSPQKHREPVKRKAPDYDLKGIRVLMCEDNPMNQDMEKRLLERMNCRVEIAGDGQIGLDMFEKSDSGYYDIVLMDIRMPNMDGLEATRAIRALDREDAKTVPIMAVSANAFEEDVQNSLEAGMNEHLAKPVDARLLYEKIKFYALHENASK